MLETTSARPASALPLAPLNPLPYRRRLGAARALATGQQLLRDSGGPVTRVVLGPEWLVPEMVFVSSPQGAHDVLMRRDSDADRASLPMMVELRKLLGGNLLNLAHEPWLPRRRALQPIFSKQRVTRMTEPIIEAAQRACRRWPDRGTIDLDDEIRGLTIRALSTSFLGLDLGAEADSVEFVHARRLLLAGGPLGHSGADSDVATHPGAAACASRCRRAAPPCEDRPASLPNRPHPRCTGVARLDGSS